MLIFGYMAMAGAALLVGVNSLRHSGYVMADKICYRSGVCDDSVWLAGVAAVLVLALLLWRRKTANRSVKTSAMIAR